MPKILYKSEEQSAINLNEVKDNGNFWKRRWGTGWRREQKGASNESVMFYFLTKTKY